MTKKQFVDRVARQIGFKPAQTRKIIDAVFAELELILFKDGRFGLWQFGTFIVCNCKARAGHNPRTQEKINIPACKRVRFRMASRFKRRLQEVNSAA